MTFKWHFHTFYRRGLVSNGAAPIECQPAPKMWSMNGSRLAPRHTSLAPAMCPCITSNYRNLHQKNGLLQNQPTTDWEWTCPGLVPFKKGSLLIIHQKSLSPRRPFYQRRQAPARRCALSKPLSSTGGKNQHHAGVNGGSKWSNPGLLQPSPVPRMESVFELDHEREIGWPAIVFWMGITGISKPSQQPPHGTHQYKTKGNQRR